MELLFGRKHHWWPKGLAKGWCNDTGKISSIRCDGKPSKPRSPKSIGYIEDGHNLLRGALWNSSFEPIYQYADDRFPALLQWASTLPHTGRISAVELYGEMRVTLARCIASLVARSPSTRNIAKIGAEYYQRRFGVSKPHADNNLIAANIRGLYASYADALERWGKFVFLFAGSGEFIFGDGFLHDFPHVAMHQSNMRCLLPLSPSIAVLWVKQAQYRINPVAMTMNLTDHEVEIFNKMIQVYSKDRVYYRSIAPKIDACFSEAEHKIWCNEKGEHHQQVVDDLIEEMLRFRGKSDH